MFYYILPLLFDLAIMAESQCDFVHTSHIACGKSIQYDDDFSIIPLFLCEKNTACHLQRLNCFTQHNVPECMLILFRSGLFDISFLSLLTLKSAKNIVTLWVYIGKERVLNADLQNIPQQAEARQTGEHLYRVVKSTGFQHARSSPWGQVSVFRDYILSN